MSLWETPLGPGEVAGVARSCKIHMRQLYDFSKPLVRASLDPEQCYINAGVYVVDLARYKEVSCRGRKGGCQPILDLGCCPRSAGPGQSRKVSNLPGSNP